MRGGGISQSFSQVRRDQRRKGDGCLLILTAEFLSGFNDSVPRTMLSFEEAKVKLESAGQSHVLRFWPELSAEERGAFLAELLQLEPAELQRHCRSAVEAASRTEERLCGRMEPVEPEFIGGVRRSDPGSLQEWEEEGPTLLISCLYTWQNRLCFFVLFWCIFPPHAVKKVGQLLWL